MRGMSFPKTPKTIKAIIYLNVSIYILCISASWFKIDLFTLLGATPYLIIEKKYLWQPFTYLFVHGNILHLFLNTLMLWFLGPELYKLWGRGFFIRYYLICGIGAGMATLLLPIIDPRSYLIATVGSSGAIFGLLLAYGLNFKNRLLYLFGLIPIKAGKLVLILAGIELISMLSQNSGPISHIAHLGGLITGFIYIKAKDFELYLIRKKYLKLNNRYKVLKDVTDIDPKDPRLWN